MKRILSNILAIAMLISTATVSFAEDSNEVSDTKFLKLKILFPDTIEARNSWITRAMYKDSGAPIPLSMAYGDYVYATVPIEYKDRAIEAYVTEAKEFTDIDDTNPDFHDFKMLSRVGVIRGNDKGEANIYDNVTRAEAVAMVMRFVGLEELAWEYTDEISARYTKPQTFGDVLKKDWFYYVVNYARNCGIIEGDSPDIFSPNRNVTREEVTVMLARALQYAGLRGTPKGIDNNADEDKISDWAKDAYEIIGRNFISDSDNTDPENPVRLLNPQKPATRADVAYILNNIQDDCQMYPSDAAVYYGFDKQMPRIDG